jgi:4-hydroxybenzoyl-CoA reductase subunit alpha
MAGNAALDAATKVRTRVVAAVADKLEALPEDLVLADGIVGVKGVPDSGVSWPEAVRLAIAAGGPLAESGSYRAPELAGPYKGAGVGISPAYSYSACVVELTCDPDTGIVEIDQIWLAHDIGRAINALLSEGQVEGSVYMGLGEALFEDHGFREALHRGPSLLEYKMPTFLDMPPVKTYLIESDDPEGPFGAKEVGQGPLLPVIPAIANAVHDALGIRIDETPITPDKIVSALRDKAKGGTGRVGPNGIPDFEFPPLTRVEPPAGVPA